MDWLWILGLLVLVTAFLPWVNMARINGLNKDLDVLHEAIRQLRIEIRSLTIESHNMPPESAQNRAQAQDQHNNTPPQNLAAPIYSPPDQQDDTVQSEKSYIYVEQYNNEISKTEDLHDYDQYNQTEYTPNNEPFVPSYDETDFDHDGHVNNFEFNLGSKLPVWIGAISLAFAAFFLVKYSIESGWLGPVVRLTLGFIFGGALLLAGHKITTSNTIPNAERVSQGLIGAGLVSLYGCLYAAVHLYQLLSPYAGFGGMVMVTALAVIFSLRHGQAIALFGLIGGFLTPILVGSTEPQAIALFTYLFLLFGGLIFVMVRQGWWMLAILALAAIYGWTGLWYLTAFVAADAPIIGLFILATCAVVFLSTAVRTQEPDEHAPKILNIFAMAGSIAVLIWLSLETHLSLFDWSIFGLLGLACVVLTYFNPQSYRSILSVKVIADLIILFLWGQDETVEKFLTITAILAGTYIALPHFLMRRTNNPAPWPSIQGMAGIGLFMMTWYMISFDPGHNHPYIWGTIALISATYAIYQTRYIILRYAGNEDQAVDQMVSEYAFLATAFISLGLVLELPEPYLPAAFAAQTAATLWVHKWTSIDSLKKIGGALLVGTIALSYKIIAIFAVLITNSIFAERFPHSLGRQISDIINNGEIFTMLALPALFIALAIALHRRTQTPSTVLINGLFATFLLMTSAFIYLLMRNYFQENVSYITKPLDFIERGFVTLAFALLGSAGLYYARWSNMEFIKPWVTAMFHLAIARIIWFDMIMLNPLYDPSQHVGDTVFFNGITLTYGCGILLCAWFVKDALQNNTQNYLLKVYGIIGFILIFVFSSLSVRHAFHGEDLTRGAISNAEMYSYSIAWLLTGLAVLSFGLLRNSKTARVASMAFIALTIGKVFLFDAAHLEGLYRVFSFMGLGFSLIGLSVFYTRFIARYSS